MFGGQGLRHDEAFDVFGCAVIKARHYTAFLRGAFDHHNHLVVQMHVHGELGLTVDFDRAVQTACCVIADELPLGGVAQARL